MEEYNAIYSKIGLVKKLGKDWQVYNIEDLQETYNKVAGIKDFKRTIIKKFHSKGGITSTRGICFITLKIVIQNPDRKTAKCKNVARETI